MARVLLAWELGAGFGHLVSLRALAQVLRGRGHECCFAVRQLGSAQDALEPELGPLYQAPLRATAGRNPVRTQVSYASLLHNTGFDDVAELAGRIRAWRELMRTLRADAVVAEHSPVALLAARTLDLPAAYLGSGFTVPPLLDPFPSFRPDLRVDEAVLRHNDAQVLQELNRALERLRLPPLARLQDLLSGALPGVLSYPELDHYARERPEPFLGMPDYAHGEAPAWPEGAGPRVFAYLRPVASLPPLLEALAGSGARVLLRISGLSPARLRRLLRPGLAIVERPVHFRLAAESCDAFVNYAAHSTVAEFLLAGKPGLLVPELHEQVLTARRAVQLGAAVAAGGKEPRPYAEGLRRVLEHPPLREAAQGFAARYRAQDRAAILPALADRLLARAPSRAPSAAA